MSLMSISQVSSGNTLGDQVGFCSASQSGSPSEREAGPAFLEVEVSSFGMLTLKQDSLGQGYYFGIKCAISGDMGLAKSLPSRSALFWKSALIYGSAFVFFKNTIFSTRKQRAEFRLFLLPLWALFQEPKIYLRRNLENYPKWRKKIAFMWNAVRAENLAEPQSK